MHFTIHGPSRQTFFTHARDHRPVYKSVAQTHGPEHDNHPLTYRFTQPLRSHVHPAGDAHSEDCARTAPRSAFRRVPALAVTPQ